MKKLWIFIILLLLMGCQSDDTSQSILAHPQTKTEFYEKTNITYEIFEVEFQHEYMEWYNDNFLELPTKLSHMHAFDETFYYLQITNIQRDKIALLFDEQTYIYMIPMFQTWLFEVTDVITDYEDGVLFVDVHYDLKPYPSTHCILIVLEIETDDLITIVFNGFEMNAFE